MNAFLPAVDLRSKIETVYHQSVTNDCTYHAVVNMLDAMYDHAGDSKRFSRAWIAWWSRVHSKRPGQDVGATFPDLKYATETHGVVLDSQHPWTGHAANFPPKDAKPCTGQITFIRVAPEVDEIKRRLCLGVPTVICARLHSDFHSLAGQKNWRTHTYNVKSQDTGIQHAMCIVGYDDAAGRLLIENSYGPGFADGGFFGLRYEDLHAVAAECWGISRIDGFVPKKAEGFMSVPKLSYTEKTQFADHNDANLNALLEAAYNTGGFQAVLDLAKTWRISDKHLERIRSWNRGTVHDFCVKTPELDWAGFTWADL